MERVLAFEVKRPRSLAEAASLLAAHPAARLVSGGTDLVPNLRRGIERPPLLVDLTLVDGLDALRDGAAGMAIGAGVTLARVATDSRVVAAFPALATAAASVAGPAHRNVATLGGNLCADTRCVFYNQSEWWRAANSYCLKRGGEICHVAPQGKRCHAACSGDVAPALLALGAEVEVFANGGGRRFPLAELYRDDGAAHLTLVPGELLAAVHIPVQPPHSRCGYRKARARGAIDFPLAGVAARVVLAGGIVRELRVALTGTNSRPFLLEGVEEFSGRTVDDTLLAQLGKLVQKQVSPMRTTVTSSNYRRQVAAVLAQRLVRELASADPEERRGR